MKVIKFRAWRNDEKYMVTSDRGVLTVLQNCYGEKGLATQAGFSDIDNQPKPDKYILMQYIGIKDSEGVEIYEGDIIRVNAYGEENLHEIIYKADKDYPAYDLEPSIDTDSNGISYLKAVAGIYITVVGNIFEGITEVDSEESGEQQQQI